MKQMWCQNLTVSVKRDHGSKPCIEQWRMIINGSLVWWRSTDEKLKLEDKTCLGSNADKRKKRRDLISEHVNFSHPTAQPLAYPLPPQVRSLDHTPNAFSKYLVRISWLIWNSLQNILSSLLLFLIDTQVYRHALWQQINVTVQAWSRVLL